MGKWFKCSPLTMEKSVEPIKTHVEQIGELCSKYRDIKISLSHIEDVTILDVKGRLDNPLYSSGSYQITSSILVPELKTIVRGLLHDKLLEIEDQLRDLGVKL